MNRSHERRQGVGGRDGASAFEAADHVGLVACDNRTTRAVAKIFRDDYKIPRKAIKAQAYWSA